MQDTVLLLNKANDSYYNSNRKILLEKEYDDLYNVLLNSEKLLGYSLPNSPTKIDNFERVMEIKKCDT